MKYERFQQRLASRLLELRQTAGLSQEQLAVRAGITRQHLQRLEAGQNDPKLETVFKLARAFRMSIGELVDAAAQGG